MISTRKRPLILGAMLLPALTDSSRSTYALEATPTTVAPPSPPTQPESGLGGADYSYDAVTATAYLEGGSVFERTGFLCHFWIFEPADALSAATPLPVVILLPDCCDFHRFATNRPDSIRSWIDHLVRRGAVVVFPTGWLGNRFGRTTADVSAALDELERGDHAPVDLSRVAVAGLGFGGAHAVNLVAAPPDGLPTPTALLLVEPFLPPEDTRTFEILQIQEAIAAIPATTHVVLVGAEAIPERDNGLDHVWLELARADTVPPGQRAYVVLRSDGHGAPALVADYTAALTDGLAVDYLQLHLDALDWCGTWKYLDALMRCAFAGEWCEYAFGNTPEQRFMGTWSDGVPVREALVIEDLATPVASVPAMG